MIFTGVLKTEWKNRSICPNTVCSRDGMISSLKQNLKFSVVEVVDTYTPAVSLSSGAVGVLGHVAGIPNHQLMRCSEPDEPKYRRYMQQELVLWIWQKTAIPAVNPNKTERYVTTGADFPDALGANAILQS